MSKRKKRNPLAGLAGFPHNIAPGAVLPHDPCTRCGKGDSNRVVFIDGDMDWLAAGLIKLADFSLDESVSYVKTYWAQFRPSQHSELRRMVALLMCRSCANDAHEATGVPVYSAARLNEPNYEFKVLAQPLGEEL